jgi:N-acetylglutamate synthase
MNTQPTTQLTPAELLSVAAGGWGYAEAEWIDGWHARASSGFTNRANSAWPIVVPGGTGVVAGGAGGADVAGAPSSSAGLDVSDLPRTLERLRAWFAARGLPAQVQCVTGSELDQAVATACGFDEAVLLSFRQDARAETLLTALAQHDIATHPNLTCVLADHTNAGWLSVYQSGALPPVAGRVLGSGDDGIRFATVTDDRDGSALAIGRVALAVPPGGAGPATWAGIGGIEVVPAARRRGLAKAVIRELIEWAVGRGVTDVFLEVFSTNAAALELYRTLGFSTHHAYHYRMIESILS